MLYLVYKTTNLVNGKFYIGCHQTENLNDGYLGSGTLLKMAIQKYGDANFKREILVEAPNRAEMFQREKELVSIGGDSYNLKSGGLGGWDHVDNTGRRPTLGRIRPQEERIRISRRQRGKPSNFLGKKKTPEQIRRNSESQKGIPKPQSKIMCPYCWKWGGNPMRTYHFENCKERGRHVYDINKRMEESKPVCESAK